VPSSSLERGEARLSISRSERRRLRWARATAGFVLAGCLLVGCSGEERKPGSEEVGDRVGRGSDSRNNVVVIVIDTLRPDHLGFYGYHRETAPYLASLAEKGVVFTRAVSTSTWTAPSTTSLFTGLHPLRHGVQLGIVAHRRLLESPKAPHGNTANVEVKVELNRIPASVSTLPELFRAVGYRTFGIASNPNIGASIGFDRGFDRFQLLEKRSGGTPEPRATKRNQGRLRWGNGEELYAELRRWKSELLSGPEPFFLYIHINDVHIPYEKHVRFYREAGTDSDRQALYDSGIGYVDDVLGKIHTELGFDDDTIILVASDHGEAFGEHEYIAHREGVYGETNRILLLLSAPGLGVEPARVESRVSIMGVLPTLLELVGASAPVDREGISFVPLLLADDGNATPAREELEQRLKERALIVHRVAQAQAQYAKDPSVSWAVMKGRWKLIHDRSRVELYDLEVDLEERENLALEHPEVRAALEAQLAEYREQTRPIESESIDLLLDPQTVEALRAIGYGD